MPQEGHMLMHSTESPLLYLHHFQLRLFSKYRKCIYRHVYFCETILHPKDVFKDIDKSKAATQLFGWYL